ncbi:hypothetical protein [Carnobacterium maltaromaticum]|uniref:hypothetical protein n=1 Tax=Carnobacterium maltaromaticum TaxID=2751 RepID=UPI00191BBAD0|nr:hypothetical protein [Carnobacterium maltaromaticum]CAD5903050.1 hypothetical protein CMALT394_610004 [Carnobacterium maltaromaticum]
MDELLDYGFEYCDIRKKFRMQLSEKDDRYLTDLTIEPGDLQLVEICIFMLKRGLVLVSEEIILKDNRTDSEIKGQTFNI